MWVIWWKSTGLPKILYMVNGSDELECIGPSLSGPEGSHSILLQPTPVICVLAAQARQSKQMQSMALGLLTGTLGQITVKQSVSCGTLDRAEEPTVFLDLSLLAGQTAIKQVQAFRPRVKMQPTTDVNVAAGGREP